MPTHLCRFSKWPIQQCKTHLFNEEPLLHSHHHFLLLLLQLKIEVLRQGRACFYAACRQLKLKDVKAM
ncbi:unnamed protein product, partial [Mesorhabditis belari]|uniref:Uncharacterized protein n=1 Tax=Mesorhabditis belari TaxID=2138241 RepID=A0AAF3EN57_9BILA